MADHHPELQQRLNLSLDELIKKNRAQTAPVGRGKGRDINSKPTGQGSGAAIGLGRAPLHVSGGQHPSRGPSRGVQLPQGPGRRGPGGVLSQHQPAKSGSSRRRSGRSNDGAVAVRSGRMPKGSGRRAPLRVAMSDLSPLKQVVVVGAPSSMRGAAGVRQVAQARRLAAHAAPGDLIGRRTGGVTKARVPVVAGQSLTQRIVQRARAAAVRRPATRALPSTPLHAAPHGGPGAIGLDGSSLQSKTLYSARTGVPHTKSRQNSAHTLGKTLAGGVHKSANQRAPLMTSSARRPRQQRGNELQTVFLPVRANSGRADNRPAQQGRSDGYLRQQAKRGSRAPLVAGNAGASSRQRHNKRDHQ